MTAFRYKALNSDGKLVNGVLEGDSERAVRVQLRGRQLRPVEVSTAAARASERWQLNLPILRRRLGAAEIALITRQLATLVASALPLDECLQAVAEQTRKSSTKALLLQVRSKVAEGYTLASSMSQFPGAFGDMYRAMVHAGEQAGQLAPVLEQLADYTENRQHTAQKLQMAMIYPLVLVAVAIAVVAALMVFVVPELVGIFAHTQKDLPALTVALIGTSDFLRDYGLGLLLILVAAVVAFRYLLRDPGRRRRWHGLLLRIPLIRGLLVSIDTARFSSTLSILMASGVPLLDALRIAGAVMSNLVLQDSSRAVAVRVQEGSSLNRALAQEPFFPPMMVHMVGSGEASGDLETMLARSANNQERELEMTLGTVMGLFEPLMVVFMGGLVLAIVLAILLPIFDLNTMVR
ncbi:general secretion pathway protein F [Luminiphilus syltensis NOR5-1B]|uniref:General secretion pathway protein F n=1 Tax=Luminiphilus syltensis NOR5-1B TaxID=565045 RepID=B8KQM6_9GAMM|nr:type II secretion system inner membrane protein GspF [Luminiphilus syltensis]EED35035.1 general secretion pathway protein F [Luminiphilus syltensis NOR5-1B]